MALTTTKQTKNFQVQVVHSRWGTHLRHVYDAHCSIVIVTETNGDIRSMNVPKDQLNLVLYLLGVEGEEEERLAL